MNSAIIINIIINVAVVVIIIIVIGVVTVIKEKQARCRYSEQRLYLGTVYIQINTK